MMVHFSPRLSFSSAGRIWSILLLPILAGFLTMPCHSAAARKSPKPPPAQGSFTDQLDVYDSTRWMKADGWKNGSPFDNAWLADHVSFFDGFMLLSLDDQQALGEPYSSGHYQTTGFHGYGCFEASFMPVAEPGVVSSFFAFAGPFDNGGNGHVNEIDIEFLGYDTWKFQANFWTNDDDFSDGHETLIDLGFDASKAFHRYGIRWTSTGIEWFVDGEFVYQVHDSPSDPTPKAQDSLLKIMMNVWPVDETAAGWAGTFAYPGEALHGIYDWVRYVAGEDCTFEAPPDPPPDPPPPPESDANTIHIDSIALQLASRGTQVIARVTVRNGVGQAVPGAAVTGAWSGIITGGDTSRKAGSDGVATFYSARSRSSGDVTFCVTGAAAEGLDYDPPADPDRCETISK